MTSAVTGRGAAYDVTPSGEFAYGAPIGGLIGFFVDAVRGACSGLLALLGGTHITGTASTITPAGAGFDALPQILEQFSAGGLAGPAELLAGIVLFMTARRTIARTLGLLAFIAFTVAYVNGYSLVDMLTALSDFLAAVAGRLEAGGA